MEDYISYDYDSILHYRYDQFSKNGQDTIVPIDRRIDKGRLGQRVQLSEKDIQRIKWLYDCSKYRLLSSCWLIKIYEYYIPMFGIKAR